MIPLWKVAILLNLVLVLGVGVGYVGWGRRAAALERDGEAARAQVDRLERADAAEAPTQIFRAQKQSVFPG